MRLKLTGDDNYLDTYRVNEAITLPDFPQNNIGNRKDRVRGNVRGSMLAGRRRNKVQRRTLRVGSQPV